MEEFQKSAAYNAVALLSVLGLFYAIYSLRKRHPGHVYTIWYAHWFTTTWASGLFYYIWANARTISSSIMGEKGILGGLAIWFFHSSFDLREEAYLLLAVYALLLLPQVLAFITSGISGCANNLLLVRLITSALTWFVIKSFAVLSGIFLAQAIACFYADPLLVPNDFSKKFVRSIIMLSISFIIAGLFYAEYSFKFRKMIVLKRRKFSPIINRMKKHTIAVHDKSSKRRERMRYAYIKKKVKNVLEGFLKY